MRIALHGKVVTPEARQCVAAILNLVSEKAYEVSIQAGYLRLLKEQGLPFSKDWAVFNDHTDLQDADFFFSIGGDGTILESALMVVPRQIPIFGINAGRLGFLASTPCEAVHSAIADLFSGKWQKDFRSLIEIVNPKPNLFGGRAFALNEFTVAKTDSSAMICVHTHIGEGYLNSYWADGLIVSTPTGSTGYSLSCGGPIVMPGSEAWVICPISPHNLSVRPLVIPDHVEVNLKVESRHETMLLSLDSRYETVPSDTVIKLRKSAHKICLVSLEGSGYFKTLRQKMNWGTDARN